MTPSAVAKLVEKWRKRAYELDLEIGTHGDDVNLCASELEAALATAPPEQAGVIHERIVTQEQLDKGIAEIADHPRAVSDGEMNAEIKELLEAIVAGRGPFKKDNYDFACSVIENAKQNAKKVLAILAQDLGKCDRCLKIKNTVLVETGFAGEHELLCGQCVSEERAQADAVLASHDQKVRAAVLETALEAVGGAYGFAPSVCAHPVPRRSGGEAVTEPIKVGDYVQHDNRQFAGEVKRIEGAFVVLEGSLQRHKLKRLKVVQRPAPAASKPEAGYE